MSCSMTTTRTDGVQLAQADRGPEAGVAAAEDRDVGRGSPASGGAATSAASSAASAASASRSQNERRPPGRTPSSGSAGSRGRAALATRVDRGVDRDRPAVGVAEPGVARAPLLVLGIGDVEARRAQPLGRRVDVVDADHELGLDRLAARLTARLLLDPGVEPAAAADPRRSRRRRSGPRARAGRRTAGAPRRATRPQEDVAQRRRHGARLPAAGVADDPVERPGRDDAAVVGGRADVVDRVDLARPAPRPRVGRLRASAAGPRAPPRRRPPGSAGRRPTRAPPGRRASAGSPARLAPGEGDDDLADRLRPPRPDLAEARLAAAARPGSGPGGSARPARAPSAGRRPRTRSPRPSARRAARRRRSPRRARAGPAACRRPATRWRCCRRACPGSGSGPRRSWPRPRRAPAGARDRRPIGGCPCTSSARRA